jgi:hypothetical protein
VNGRVAMTLRSMPGQVLAVAVTLTVCCTSLQSGIANPADATSESMSGSIQGRVVLGDAPGAYANVILVGSRRGAQCDEAGRFKITLVPPGVHTLRILLVGFEPKSLSIVVQSGTDLKLPDIILDGRKNSRGGWSPHEPGCDSTRSPSDPRTNPISAIGLVDTTGWQWVGGSVFDFPLPRRFHRPPHPGIGIDSEVGSWEDSERHVWYDRGQYTGFTTSGLDYRVEAICLGGVPAQVAIYRRSDDPSLVVEAYFPEVRLGLYGQCSKESDRKTLLTAFRCIRFHASRQPKEPRSRE